MARNVGADRDNELQRKLAVIAGCSWLLFLRRPPETPSVSAAEANPLAVNFLHYQRTRRLNPMSPARRQANLSKLARQGWNMPHA